MHLINPHPENVHKKLICGSIGSCEMAKGGAKGFSGQLHVDSGGEMERGDDLKGGLLN